MSKIVVSGVELPESVYNAFVGMDDYFREEPFTVKTECQPSMFKHCRYDYTTHLYKDDEEVTVKQLSE